MRAEGREIRVLLVDDSPTVRAVLQRLLRSAPDLRVVGEAADGEDGIRLAVELLPDVILMDLAMPRLDGFAATAEIMSRAPTAIVVFSTGHLADHKRVFDVCARGARTVLAKPDSPEGWTKLAETLPDLIRDVAREFDNGHRRLFGSPLPDSLAGDGPLAAEPLTSVFPTPLRYLAVGASTGGPEALRELLEGLAPRPPMTVLVVQHIAAEFEEGLAEWLRSDLHLDVRLASDGEQPAVGAVRLAPQGFHLRLEPEGRLRLDALTPPVKGHRPSADVLLRSCASTAGRQTAGILLSGMGRDGVAGLLALREAGGITAVQDRATSVVFGMPQAALEVGAAELALPPPRLARYLMRTCGAERP